MLNRINLYCWLVALAIIIFGAFYIDYQNGKIEKKDGEIEQLTNENKELKNSWEKEKQNVIQNGRRIKELREKIEKDKNSSDWSVVSVPDVVTSVLCKHYRESQD